MNSYAIIPAAGHSERMGAPKLLLPCAGRPVIEHVLEAWATSAVTRTVVVARAGDDALLACCRRFDVDLVTPSAAPPDMKASVHLALHHIAAQYSPAANDAWLLAPADMPRLSPQLINRVLQTFDPASPAGVIPAASGKRGHPLLLPWSTAPLVHNLQPHEGVDALVDRLPLTEISWPDSSAFKDVDTPNDLSTLQDLINCGR